MKKRTPLEDRWVTVEITIQDQKGKNIATKWDQHSSQEIHFPTQDDAELWSLRTLMIVRKFKTAYEGKIE